MNHHSPEDRLALLASVDRPTEALRIPHGDIIGVADAARLANVSDETVRRWCVKYGIGRKYRANSWSDHVWQVSKPGLLIVAARDWDALELLLSDRREDPLLSSYLNAA